MCWTLNSNENKTQTNEKNDNKNRLYVRIANRNFRIEEGITFKIYCAHHGYGAAAIVPLVRIQICIFFLQNTFFWG